MSRILHRLARQATEEDYKGPEAFANTDARDQSAVAELLSRSLTGSTDHNGGFCRMYPGWYHLRHWHPNAAEWYLILKGECWVHIDGADVRARPGTAIYIPTRAVHAIKNDTDQVVELAYGLNLPEYGEAGCVYAEYEEPRAHRVDTPSPYVRHLDVLGWRRAAAADGRGGDEYCELISRERTGSGDLLVGMRRVPPGARHAAHHHPHAAGFVMVTAGECVVTVQGEPIRAGQYTAVYIPRGAVHALHNDSDRPVELIYGLDVPSAAMAGYVRDA